MITFSVNQTNGVDSYAMEVWKTINDNLGYFRMFNLDRWEEAVHRTYITALENRDFSFSGNLLPYIKKLARHILQVQSRESIYGVFTDEGEISPVFASLQDHIKMDALDGSSELKDAFKEIYLKDPESFLRFKTIFMSSDLEEVEASRAHRMKNPELNQEIRSLAAKHGVEYTYAVLYEFFQELPMLTAQRNTHQTKEIMFKKPNYAVIEKIPDTPTIVDAKGNFHFIDKNTLTMEENPDYLKWDIIGTSSCDILKIDLAPFMDHMYNEVCVDQGVSTRHVMWCGDKYSLTTPAGDVRICMDPHKFLEVVRIELLTNLLMSNIGSVVAISPDNLYIKPTRSFQFDKIRLKFKSGKQMDLPITVHLRKRK